MKLFVAFALLLVSITASPAPLAGDVETSDDVENRLVVASVVQGMIDDIIKQIKDGNMDPWNLANISQDYALAVPSLFSASGHLIGARCIGLSEIITNTMSYGLLNSRLTFDVVLRSIDIGVDSAAIEVESFGGKVSASVKGGITIRNLGVFGTIRVSVGLLSGVTLSNPDLNFQMEGVDSNLEVAVLGKERSDQINHYASVVIPSAIKAHEADLNEFINLVATEVIENM